MRCVNQQNCQNRGRLLIVSIFFKFRTNFSEDVKRCKAPLVFKSYSQGKGMENDETYLLVTRYFSVRFVLAMAFKHNLIIHPSNVCYHDRLAKRAK